MGMVEYKDISELKKQIADFKRAVHSTNSDYLTGYISALSVVEGMIAELPDADAVEVVHGRWEDEHGGKYANPRYRCSVCNKRALYKFEIDLLDNWHEVQALTPICPYCMAVLDGGKDNDI